MAVSIGLIGMGRIGKIHAGNIVAHIRDASLTGVADIDMASAKEIGSRCNVQFITDDYREIINNPDIQAIFICSATHTHAYIK